MKNKIVLSIFAIASIIVLCSNSGGYSGNLTGATGGSGCGNCHGSTSANAVTVELDSAGIPVTSYRAGLAYTVKITGTNNTGLSLPKFGCQVCVVKTLNAGTSGATQAGTWGTLPASMQSSGGALRYIQHSARLNPVSGTGANGTVYTQVIPWTAPVAGTGTIKIYGVINAVNNVNGSDAGDRYQVAPIVTIPESVPAAVASVSIAITSGSTTICSGSSVTFTATPTNGGTAPTYQWKVGATVVGTGSTYTGTTLANGNVVTCVMTSNLSGVTGNPATSNAITMTVNPTVTASVSIAATATTICAGNSVTFTATPTNGGTPTYQWRIGTTVVGTGSTYTTTTLANGNVVSCVMTPTGNCVTPTTATSNSITMTVNPALTASVSIAATATTICAGTSVTFTATPTNGGTPTYQWKVGATVVGTGPTYTTTTLANGNVVTCVMTPTGNCVTPATATSNAIAMTVNPIVTDSVNITTTASTICAGTSVTFTAHTFNGGATPTYQWRVGTTAVGTGATYTSTVLANGNVVSCIMTPSGTCVSPSTATSNSITMTVNPALTASVSIAATATTICAGTSVTFTATPTNGGTPTYQWKVGATVVGTGPTYTTTTLANGNVVTCIMTPTGNCVTPAKATSKAITMTVNPAGAPSVTISASSNPICAGNAVTFTPVPVNGGANPAYQWYIGSTVSGTGSTFTTTALTNGQAVSCVMTSSSTCASPATANSNVIVMTVNSAPVTDSVQIVATATNICAGTSVTFTAQPYNGGLSPTYQWRVGTAVVSTGVSYTTSTLANGNVVTCIMTPSGSCVSPPTSTSNAITVTVTPTVRPAITITGRTNLCAGQADTFSAQITAGGLSPVFSWTVNGAAAGANSSSLIRPSVTGAITVVGTLTSSATCASPAAVADTVTVNVTPVVTPAILISTADDTVCSGRIVNFTAATLGQGGNPAYQWLVNTTPSGSGNSFSSATLANGDVVSCVLTSSATCTSPGQVTSNAIPVTVLQAPTAALVPSGNVSVCAGDSVLLVAAGGGIYLWSDSSVNDSVYIRRAGSYNVTVTAANGCATSAVNPATLTVNTPVVPTISRVTDTITSSLTAVTYQWLRNDTILGGGDTTQSITLRLSGNYKLVVTDANGCRAVSVPNIFVYTPDTTSHPDTTHVGISMLNADLGVRLYPVPNKGSFMIDMADYADAQLVIYDMYGHALHREVLTSAHQEVRNVALVPALYFVQVASGDRVQVVKMQVVE